MNKLTLIFITVLFVSACSIFPTVQKAISPTAAPTVEEQVVPPTLEPTQVVLPTETVVVVPTIQPTKEPPKEPTPTDIVPVATATTAPVLEAWRLAPIPGSELAANDHMSNPDLDQSMAGQAANLAIAAPFNWEIYDLPAAPRALVVKDYYIPLITEKGYKLNNDTQGANDVYLMSFVRIGDNKSRIFVQFQTKTAKRPSLVMIFYKNP
jgi:hypothetical protein